MGYSVATVIQPRFHGKMLEFLAENWRGMKELTGGGGYISDPSDDLFYSHLKHQIGFDYNASGRERFYAFLACKWLAVTVGVRRSKLRVDDGFSLTFPTPVPYYVYDGFSKMPVIPGELPEGIVQRGRSESLEWCRVDETGVSLLLGLNDCDPFEEFFRRVPDWMEANPFPEKGDVEKWSDARDRYFQDEIREHLKPVIDEVRRLDALWRGANG